MNLRDYSVTTPNVRLSIINITIKPDEIIYVDFSFPHKLAEVP